METFLIRALQLILCFSILIVLHEGGHFLAAKIFKVRVEKFCLFFDPWFTLFKFKPKHSETIYALGWLPLGGYVKIAGMIDESMDTDQMKRPPQPWEFRAHPAWQRLIIMLAGVFVNFIVAIFIYAMILFAWGETYTPVENMTYGMQFNEQAHKLGFRDGDILLGTNTEKFLSFDSNESVGRVYRALSNSTMAYVLRDGKRVSIPLSGDMNMLTMIKSLPPFVQTRIPSVVDSVIPSSPAMKAGMRAGDRILAYNGRSVETWNEINLQQSRTSDALTTANHADSMNLRRLSLVVRHKGATTNDTIALTMDADYKMGVTYGQVLRNYGTRKVNFGFFESFPAGINHGVKVLRGYVDDLKYVFTKDGAKSMGSFGAIGSMFPAKWNWQRFWELTAFISIILAFMNILPIPALDGGHAFFLICEMVSRRKLSEKFMIRAQIIGMTLLVLLMLWAITNDVRNYLF